MSSHSATSLPPGGLASQLTLGLLHQVNNVLTGIYFNVDECRELQVNRDQMSGALSEIGEALENLHRLLERTAGVNQPISDDDPGHWDFEDLVSSQLDLVRILVPKTVAIEMGNLAAPACVFVDEAAFRHAFLSLVLLLSPSLRTARTRLVIELESLEESVTVRLRAPAGEWELPPGVMEELHDFAAQHGWQVTPEPGLVVPRVFLEE